MNPEHDHDMAEELSRLLLETITLAKPPQLPAGYASVPSLQTLHGILIALRDFLYAASNGDLSRPFPYKGYIAGALKTLQSNLKHMTWQTKMIASGDFTQRVEFMGEFSQSFNAMVMQLDQILQEVERKDAELRKVNEDLLNEIISRKEIEAALRVSEEAFRALARTDSLTGLYNRRYFNQLAEDEINRALRYNRPLSVMMLDIDFFKRVNDTYGHASGDLVLKMVAQIIRERIRTTDTPARYGGEEFILLLPETTAVNAVIVAETLRKKMAATIVQGENCAINITASFGVNDYLGETDAKTSERILSEFISRADQALYAAKDTGRNRVILYSPDQEAKL